MKAEKTIKKILGKDGYDLMLAFLCEGLMYFTGGQAKEIKSVTLKFNDGFISKLNVAKLEIEHRE